MAGQGTGRREMIRVMGLAAVASRFPGFHRWVFVCEHSGMTAAAPPDRTNVFVPQFFTSDEFRLLDRLAELIIPTDEYPGAHEAGVPEFIDFMVANGADLSREQDGKIQERFRTGLSWINAYGKSDCGSLFLECSEAQQIQMLEPLAYKKRFRTGEEIGQNFFRLMRDYTAKGYYTSRVGLEALGSPSLQTMWAAMPGCPHLDDPEHLHLRQPVI